ncbi:MAG: DNA alkylation repair protein [Myxococcota bacterium]
MTAQALQALSQELAQLPTDGGSARQVRCLRGVRGVPTGELTRRIAQAAASLSLSLPADDEALTALFGTAWEDGLAAIGLLATVAPQQPAEALALGLEWAERTDDVATADALGWLVLGPAALLADDLPALLALRGQGRPETRRAAVSAGLAWTPEPFEGPAAAGLRERAGTRTGCMSPSALEGPLAVLCDKFVRDEAPAVRKALRRVLKAWASADPARVTRWAAAVRGGLPKMLSAVVP